MKKLIQIGAWIGVLGLVVAAQRGTPPTQINSPITITPSGGSATGISGTLTVGRIPYASGAQTLVDSAHLTFDGTKVTITSPYSSADDFPSGLAVYASNTVNSVQSAYFSAYMPNGQDVVGTESDVFLDTVSSSNVAYSFASLLEVDGAAITLTKGIGYYGYAPNAFASDPGVITTYVHFWGDAIGNKATNAYAFWADEQGVFRIRSDNTFNSVYQAIPALYNPQFTKYTPGAANFERCIPGCQWESNVATITTEKGGTGTLRALNLGDASVQVQVNGKNLTLSGNLVTTGSFNPTFAIPSSSTWTYPSGGGTLLVSGGTLTGRYVASGATPTVANVGANSCGTTAATIAGNDNAGDVTVGATAGTQCRLTLTAAAPNKWDCTVNNTTTANLARATPVSTTQVDMLGTFVAGDVVNYNCTAR